MSIEEHAILAFFALFGLTYLIFPAGWAKLMKAMYNLENQPGSFYIRAIGVVWLVIVASFYFQ